MGATPNFSPQAEGAKFDALGKPVAGTGIAELLSRHCHFTPRVSKQRPKLFCGATRTKRARVKFNVTPNVQPVHAELLKFDFRNGPLRRKYDAVKYVSKALEDLIYQLSFFGDGDAKRQRLDGDAGVGGESGEGGGETGGERPIDFAALRGVLDAFDLTREEVIKKSRDITKAGKAAIYSLLRGNAGDADKQLAKGEEAAKNLLENELRAAPSLRSSGPFSGGLEELGEAVFLRSWLTTRTPESGVVIWR